MACIPLGAEKTIIAASPIRPVLGSALTRVWIAGTVDARLVERAAVLRPTGAFSENAPVPNGARIAVVARQSIWKAGVMTLVI